MNRTSGLLVEPILEDKTVKFGGMEYPKNGWAVFMAGGPASSKSSTIKNQLLIDGLVLDNDAIIDYYINYSKKLLKDPNLDDAKKEELKKIFENIDLNDKHLENNPEYNTTIHDKLEDKQLFLRKLQNFLNINSEFLSNIIIDSTSSNTMQLVRTANICKYLGYKLSLIWVVANINSAIKRNNNRERRLDLDYLIQTHKQIISSLPGMFKDGTFDMFDEVWVVFSRDISDFSKSFNEKYANTAFKLDKIGNSFVLPKKLNRKVIQTVDKEHVDRSLYKPLDDD
jgi:hypothetical protein